MVSSYIAVYMCKLRYCPISCTLLAVAITVNLLTYKVVWITCENEIYFRFFYSVIRLPLQINVNIISPFCNRINIHPYSAIVKLHYCKVASSKQFGVNQDG